MFYLEFTCDLIKRSVNNFINSIPGQKYKKQHKKLNKIITALKHASQLMVYTKHQDKTPFEPIINALLDNELLIIPIAHAGHAITFISYGDIWIKCDRGVNHFADTVMIYKANNPYALTKNFIRDLIYKIKTDEFINKELKKLLSLQYIQKLPTRSQLSGNCSWANVEASVPAALFALSFSDEYDDRVKTGQLKRSIMSFYTAWVEWDKDSALEELINNFENTTGVRQISKAVILSSIFVQRCHHKRASEVARAKKIIPCLANAEYKFLLEKMKKNYNKVRADKIGENIMRLMDICDLNLDTLELNNIKKLPKTSSHNEIRMTTALHVACLSGKYESVKYLMEKLVSQNNFNVDEMESLGLEVSDTFKVSDT